MVFPQLATRWGNNLFINHWLREQAHVLQDTFSVFLHGVITASVMDITTTGRVMLAENKALFPLAEYVYSGWLSKGRAKKTKTSVAMAFSSPEDANRAIDLKLASSRFLPRKSKSSTGCHPSLTITSLSGLSLSGSSLIASPTPPNQVFLTERTLLRHCWDTFRAELANRSGLGRCLWSFTSSVIRTKLISQNHDNPLGFLLQDKLGMV